LSAAHKISFVKRNRKLSEKTPIFAQIFAQKFL